ncbi:MAG: dihydroneopterin triphosphate diphosphatase [Methylophilaceae bacterium]
MIKSYKIPISVLIVIYSKDLQVLLLHRKDKKNFWQSVTGSIEPNEAPKEAALREVKEETAIDCLKYPLQDWNLSNEYEIFSHWRHRYAPGVTHNIEHVFGLEVPSDIKVKLSPREHTEYVWLDIAKAKEKVFSWTNKIAIEKLDEIKRYER